MPTVLSKDDPFGSAIAFAQHSDRYSRLTRSDGWDGLCTVERSRDGKEAPWPLAEGELESDVARFLYLSRRRHAAELVPYAPTRRDINAVIDALETIAINPRAWGLAS